MLKFLYRVVLVVMLVSSSTIYAEEQSAGEVKYYPIIPEIVTNLHSNTKPVFLQIRVEFMTRGEAAYETLKYHDPYLRDMLIDIINQQNVDVLTTTAGRQQLRKLVLSKVQNLLEEETGEALVEKVLFTNVVVE